MSKLLDPIKRKIEKLEHAFGEALSQKNAEIDKYISTNVDLENELESLKKEIQELY